MIIKWLKDPLRSSYHIRGPWMFSEPLSIFNSWYYIYIAKDINGFYSLSILSNDENKNDLYVNDIPMSKYDDTSVLVLAHEVFEYYILTM